MYGVALYVKEGLPFCKRLIPRKLLTILVLVCDPDMFDSVCYFFPLSIISSFLYTGLDAISSNLDDVLSINPFAYVFFFGHFNVHHEDCLTYSGVTDRPDR